MAERIVSPGVFTNEYDQSFLPTAIGQIGAAFIGPTSRGPAFIPTVVRTYQEFIEKFGGANDDTYLPHAVRSYLENTGTATIVRILNLTGYKATNIPLLLASPSGSALKVAAVLHPTYRTWTTAGTGLNSSYITGSASTFDSASGYASASNFNIVLSGSASSTSSTFTAVTLDPSEANYIGKAIGISPRTNATTGAYSYRYSTFDNYLSSIIDMTGSSTPFVTMSLASTLNLSGSDIYSDASTPSIKSQLVNGISYPLFKVHTIAQGQDVNSAYKIGILNIKKAGEVPGSDYGSFTLVVREADDTDRAPMVVETYSNLTLDPNSTNYICRVIGDRYATYNTTYKKIVWNGDYPNKSKYIYIEPEDDLKNGVYSPDLVPYGFAAVIQPMACPAGVTFPTASMVKRQLYNNIYNSRIYFGFDFDFDTSDNLNYLMPIPADAVSGSNLDFKLDECFTETESTVGAVSLSSSVAPLSARKFVVPFQGGFDGFDPSKQKMMGTNITSTNTMGLDCSTANSEGYKAYKYAIDLLSNADQYDINMLLTPGIIDTHHSSIVSYAVDMCESRGDCFYIFDAAKLDSYATTDATTQAANYDTNYAATYYPWVKIFDAERNKYIWVPASVPVAGAISYNDKVGYEWWAPAGLNRGVLSTARDVYNVLSQPERDELYEGRVNPISPFPNEGIVVWGQKTLQTKSSALDRVSVRRLLINLKKFIASTSKYLVFESNTTATRNKFLNTVNPYMESIQQKSGLYAFKVIMDETNNDADVIDRNILYGQIFIQPTKTAEFVLIDFNVMPTGATFPE